MKNTTLLIVSDEAMTRFCLRHFLASEAGFEVRGEVHGKEAASQAGKLLPDVTVVLDEGTRTGCAQLVASIREAAPDTRIVILGRETNHVYLGLLLASGALGYVLVQSSLREMVDAFVSFLKVADLWIVSCATSFSIYSPEKQSTVPNYSAVASVRFSP